MQFVKDGPEIPEHLLQAHEDGQVVFFCGAGISCPAGLPLFGSLVNRVYRKLRVQRDAVQHAAFRAKRFDTALGLLEGNGERKREAVRRAVAEILSPNLALRDATTTHEALLTLSKTRKGHTRLITTNVDRIFEAVIRQRADGPKRSQAPLVPMPKSRWDGLVYLHGLLEPEPDRSNLDSLVLTSGDFGLAYLNERRAARFVGELFRNYTVCFVGYSIDDPVLRYMMDSLAAERFFGETRPEAFAFGVYSKDKEEECWNEWQAKNVTPILYRAHWRHAYLHRTLREWAATYGDGIRGKEHIVLQSARARPTTSTKQDDFVSRLLWAIGDKSGVPAQRFADMDPVPSLDWLEPLSEERFGHSDLIRFDVPPKEGAEEEPAFSLTRRPAPYDLAPRMALVDSGARGSRWDMVMVHLARWLLRHLDDPNLVLWLAKRGGQLHENLARWIERRIEEIAKLEDSGEITELARIRENAPNAIPSPRMRTLWHLLLTGRVASPVDDLELYSWRDRFRREGLTVTLRLQLREKLTPRVVLREPFRWPFDELEGFDEEPGEADALEPMAKLVESEIVLSTNYVHAALNELHDDERWTTALAGLLGDLSALLRDTLDLMRELGDAEDKSDQSYVPQPSISEHPQNRKFHDWTALIDLSRDAWMSMARQSPDRAIRAADDWWRIPYPVFRRLALFAAAQKEMIPSRRGLKWLLADERWWLWSIETQREAIRLLVSIGRYLDEPEFTELEQAILAGPPRIMFRDDIEPESWIRIREREIWLRLAKISDSGVKLSTAGNERLKALSARYPEWRLAEDERDEFPHWMDGGGAWRTMVPSPGRRRELLEWLKANPDPDDWQQDDWQDRCRRNFATCAWALRRLAREDIWVPGRWREALRAWGEDELLGRAWCHMAPVLINAPDEDLRAMVYAVSWWLRSLAKTFQGQEDIFVGLCTRVLELGYKSDDDTRDPVDRAINHPVGQVTEALLRWWYRSSLNDGQRLPDSLKPTLTDLCNLEVDEFRHGRVLRAANLIALFRVDPDWAKEHVIPLFDWNGPELEARAAWEGFLWSPRLYRPLTETLKQAFLDTAKHYAKLGKHRRQYAAVLTFVALDPGDIFKPAELAQATRALPQEGLADAAEALARSLDGAGKQQADFWKNRVWPYLRNVWPPMSDPISNSAAESLALVCVGSADEFPNALKQLRPWLQAVPYADRVVREIHASKICEQFPAEALELLCIVVGDDSPWEPEELGACLDTLRATDPELENKPCYLRLREYLRLRGKG